jgi:hypothetical protein
MIQEIIAGLLALAAVVYLGKKFLFKPRKKPVFAPKSNSCGPDCKCGH